MSNSCIKDLEDALQAGAAISFGADIIVTRDIFDFKKLSVKAMTPSEFVKIHMTEFVKIHMTDDSQIK